MTTEQAINGEYAVHEHITGRKEHPLNQKGVRNDINLPNENKLHNTRPIEIFRRDLDLLEGDGLRWDGGWSIKLRWKIKIRLS